MFIAKCCLSTGTSWAWGIKQAKGSVLWGIDAFFGIELQFCFKIFPPTGAVCSTVCSRWAAPWIWGHFKTLRWSPWLFQLPRGLGAWGVSNRWTAWDAQPCFCWWFFSLPIGDILKLSKTVSPSQWGDFVGGVCWRAKPRSPVVPLGPWGQALP